MEILCPKRYFIPVPHNCSSLTYIPIKSIKHAIAYLVLASKMVLMQPLRNKNPVNV